MPVTTLTLETDLLVAGGGITGVCVVRSRRHGPVRA